MEMTTITIDRAVVEQALEALWDKETAEAKAFRAAHPAPGA